MHLVPSPAVHRHFASAYYYSSHKIGALFPASVVSISPPRPGRRSHYPGYFEKRKKVQACTCTSIRGSTTVAVEIVLASPQPQQHGRALAVSTTRVRREGTFASRDVTCCPHDASTGPCPGRPCPRSIWCPPSFNRIDRSSSGHVDPIQEGRLRAGKVWQQEWQDYREGSDPRCVLQNGKGG